MSGTKYSPSAAAQHDPMLSDIHKETLSNGIRRRIVQCFWQVKGETSNEMFGAYFWSVNS